MLPARKKTPERRSSHARKLANRNSKDRDSTSEKIARIARMKDEKITLRRLMDAYNRILAAIPDRQDLRFKVVQRFIREARQLVTRRYRQGVSKQRLLACFNSTGLARIFLRSQKEILSRKSSEPAAATNKTDDSSTRVPVTEPLGIITDTASYKNASAHPTVTATTAFPFPKEETPRPSIDRLLEDIMVHLPKIEKPKPNPCIMEWCFAFNSALHLRFADHKKRINENLHYSHDPAIDITGLSEGLLDFLVTSTDSSLPVFGESIQCMHTSVAMAVSLSLGMKQKSAIIVTNTADSWIPVLRSHSSGSTIEVVTSDSFDQSSEIFVVTPNTFYRMNSILSQPDVIVVFDVDASVIDFKSSNLVNGKLIHLSLKKQEPESSTSSRPQCKVAVFENSKDVYHFIKSTLQNSTEERLVVTTSLQAHMRPLQQLCRTRYASFLDVAFLTLDEKRRYKRFIIYGWCDALAAALQNCLAGSAVVDVLLLSKGDLRPIIGSIYTDFGHNLSLPSKYDPFRKKVRELLALKKPARIQPKPTPAELQEAYLPISCPAGYFIPHVPGTIAPVKFVQAELVLQYYYEVNHQTPKIDPSMAIGQLEAPPMKKSRSIVQQQQQHQQQQLHGGPGVQVTPGGGRQSVTKSGQVGQGSSAVGAGGLSSTTSAAAAAGATAGGRMQIPMQDYSQDVSGVQPIHPIPRATQYIPPEAMQRKALILAQIHPIYAGFGIIDPYDNEQLRHSAQTSYDAVPINDYIKLVYAFAFSNLVFLNMPIRHIVLPSKRTVPQLWAPFDYKNLSGAVRFLTPTRPHHNWKQTYLTFIYHVKGSCDFNNIAFPIENRFALLGDDAQKSTFNYITKDMKPDVLAHVTKCAFTGKINSKRRRKNKRFTIVKVADEEVKDTGMEVGEPMEVSVKVVVPDVDQTTEKTIPSILAPGWPSDVTPNDDDPEDVDDGEDDLTKFLFQLANSGVPFIDIWPNFARPQLSLKFGNDAEKEKPVEFSRDAEHTGTVLFDTYSQVAGIVLEAESVIDEFKSTVTELSQNPSDDDESYTLVPDDDEFAPRIFFRPPQKVEPPTVIVDFWFSDKTKPPIPPEVISRPDSVEKAVSIAPYITPVFLPNHDFDMVRHFIFSSLTPSQHSLRKEILQPFIPETGPLPTILGGAFSDVQVIEDMEVDGSGVQTALKAEKDDIQSNMNPELSRVLEIFPEDRTGTLRMIMRYSASQELTHYVSAFDFQLHRYCVDLATSGALDAMESMMDTGSLSRKKAASNVATDSSGYLLRLAPCTCKFRPRDREIKENSNFETSFDIYRNYLSDVTEIPDIKLQRIIAQKELWKTGQQQQQQQQTSAGDSESQAAKTSDDEQQQQQASTPPPPPPPPPIPEPWSFDIEATNRYIAYRCDQRILERLKIVRNLRAVLKAENHSRYRIRDDVDAKPDRVSSFTGLDETSSFASIL